MTKYKVEHVEVVEHGELSFNPSGRLLGPRFQSFFSFQAYYMLAWLTTPLEIAMEITQDRIEYLVHQVVAIHRMTELYKQLAESQQEQQRRRLAIIMERDLEKRQRQRRLEFLAERRIWKRQHPGRSSSTREVRGRIVP